jgi:hypothetical protein
MVKKHKASQEEYIPRKWQGTPIRKRDGSIKQTINPKYLDKVKKYRERREMEQEWRAVDPKRNLLREYIIKKPLFNELPQPDHAKRLDKMMRRKLSYSKALDDLITRKPQLGGRTHTENWRYPEDREQWNVASDRFPRVQALLDNRASIRKVRQKKKEKQMVYNLLNAKKKGQGSSILKGMPSDVFRHAVGTYLSFK